MPADPESLYAQGLISDDAMDRLRETMTHRPQGPNPAAPYLQDARNFASGGIYGILKGRGVETPQWADSVDEFLHRDDVNSALGMASPGASRAKQLFESGLSYSQIAERLGTTRSGVAGTLRDLRGAGELGAAKPSPVAFSNPELWNAAKELRRQGWNDADIARQLKVSPMSVSKAFSRGGATDMTPGLPQLKFMQRPAEDIDPAELKQYLDIFSAK